MFRFDANGSRKVGKVDAVHGVFLFLYYEGGGEFDVTRYYVVL